MSHEDNFDNKLMALVDRYLKDPDDPGIEALVRDYQHTVRAQEKRFELRHIVRYLGRLFEGRDRAAVRILDHGCGGWGASVFALISLGFTQARGIHIGGMERMNALARRYFGADADPFSGYEGRILPFDDESFDFIFSEQVLEHVSDEAIEDYYREEARVLAPGGYCLHQAPHRLRPYDSHTGTWMIHYLPRGVWLGALKMMGKDVALFRDSLFLRSRGFHYAQLRRFFDSHADVTVERVRDYDPAQFFDGPQGLRNLIDRCMRFRPLAPLAESGVRALFTYSTLAHKRSARQPADGLGKL